MATAMSTATHTRTLEAYVLIVRPHSRTFLEGKWWGESCFRWPDNRQWRTTHHCRLQMSRAEIFEGFPCTNCEE